MNLIGKWIAGIVIGLTAIGGCYSLITMGEEVFNGPMDGQEIVYEEGRINPIGRGDTWDKNTMTIKEGASTYTLIDCVDETDIEWRSEKVPDFMEDKLEAVIIDSSGSKRTYTRSDINETTIEGLHAKRVFENADKLYNQKRAKIRAKLRAEHKAKLKLLEDGLKPEELPVNKEAALNEPELFETQ